MEKPLVQAEFPAGGQDAVDQPGLAVLRTAFANRARTLAGKASIRKDAIAGLNAALSSVPLDRKLRASQVTVLDVYGSLFYGGARTLERLLPQPQGSRNTVVILRLRGRASLGATLVTVLADYARKLAAADGRLYLSGLAPDALRELTGSRKFDLTGPVRAFEVTPVLGESTRAARADAEAWLIRAPESALQPPP
ncbi:MAG: hypothetical protein LBV50_11500 [Novosphingobium sp.]|nr:hypothetical protein [Novosphingobium sp.]